MDRHVASRVRKNFTSQKAPMRDRSKTFRHRSLTKFATRSPQPRANPWNSNAKWPLASFRLKMSQCWLLTSSGGENEGIGWILTPTPGFPLSGRQTLLDRAPANRYPLPSLSRSLGNSFWISGGSEQRPMGLRRKRRRYTVTTTRHNTVTTQSQQHSHNNTSSKFIHPLRRPCHGRNFVMDFEGNRHGSVRAYR